MKRSVWCTRNFSHHLTFACLVFYPFRCPTDPALAVFPWNRTTFAFRFQTIRFLGANPVFYVTCDTFVCTVQEKNADCDQSCETGSTGKRRRRRRHVSDAGHTMYHVVGGPFQVVNTGETIQQPTVHVHPQGTTPSRSLNTAPSPPLEPGTPESVSQSSPPRDSYVSTLSHQVTWAPSTTQGARTPPVGRGTTLAVTSSPPSRKSTTSTTARSNLHATTSHPRRSTVLKDLTGRSLSVTASTALRETSQRTGEVNVIKVPQEAQSPSSSKKPKASASESSAPKVESHSQRNSQSDFEGQESLPGEISGRFIHLLFFFRI